MLNTWKPSKAQEEVTDFCHSMFGGEAARSEELGAPPFPLRIEIFGWTIAGACLPPGGAWLGRSSVMLAKRIDFRLSARLLAAPQGGFIRAWRVIAGRWSLEFSRPGKLMLKPRIRAEEDASDTMALPEPSSLWVGKRNFTWVRLNPGASWHSSGGEPGEAVLVELSCALYEGGPLQSDYLIRRLIAGRWNVCTQIAI